MPRISNKPIQLLKGFKDILPEHQKYWDFFMGKALVLLQSYGYGRIDLPVIEQTNLYLKGTGKHTDIVSKELYNFEDKGGENVTVRPEFTPGICRAYIEHGMLNRPQPVKFYAYGPVFRHDNPQSGRFRQFNQLDLEVIGSENPVVDAELIIIAYRLLESLGLSVEVRLNSIGCPECRPEYITSLKQYLSSGGRKKSLCENCRERYTKNPLRMLDCKNEQCQQVFKEAPQIVDFLCDQCKKNFMEVLEQLDDLGVLYQLDVRLVRGLDYYNGTAFEIYLKQDDLTKSQSALVGGGRYDGLIEILGGRPTPASGFAIGIERLISKMRELKIEPPIHKKPDIFVAQLGSEARKECFRLFERLMSRGFKVAEAFSKDGLKNQLERADSVGAKFSLILGQRELLDKTIIIRDMQSGIQEIINYDKVMDVVSKRLETASSSVKVYIDKDNANKGSDKNEVEISGPSGKDEPIDKNKKPKYKLNPSSDDNERTINRL